MEYEENRALDLNETITYDKDNDFVILQPGDYDFSVTGIERQQYAGGTDKNGNPTPACVQMIISMHVTNGLQATNIKHTFFLTTKNANQIYRFFISVGLAPADKSAPLNLNLFNQVIGRTGKCRVRTRTYKGRNGDEMQANQIDRFYEPFEATAAPAPAAPAYTPTTPAPAPAPQPQQQTWGNAAPNGWGWKG